MSLCPTHKQEAHHTAVVIEWDSRRVLVRHFCTMGHGDDYPDSIGDGHSWLEPARDPDAVLAKVGLCRIKDGAA